MKVFGRLAELLGRLFLFLVFGLMLIIVLKSHLAASHFSPNQGVGWIDRYGVAGILEERFGDFGHCGFWPSRIFLKKCTCL